MEQSCDRSIPVANAVLRSLSKAKLKISIASAASVVSTDLGGGLRSYNQGEQFVDFQVKH